MLKKHSGAHSQQISIDELCNLMKKLDEKKQAMSLFDKLQKYDQYVGQLKLDRKNPKVLSIFEETIGKFLQFPGKGSQRQQISIKKQRSEAYSSPYKNKLQNDIQDPELFSFSKQRKQSQYLNRDAQTEKLQGLSIILKQKLGKLRKGKQHSDKPRYTAPVLSEPNEGNVSQFNLQSQSLRPKQSKKQEDYIHDQSKRLVNRLKTSYGKALVFLLKRQIKETKKEIKIKTSQYIHELNLLKKSIKALKRWNIETDQIVNNFKQQKRAKVIKILFDQWSEYAGRSEQQKIRDEEIQIKQGLLPKIIFLRRFIYNSFFNLEVQQRLSAKLSAQARKKDLKQKERKVYLLTFMNSFKKTLMRKKQIISKKTHVQKNRRFNSFKDFNKLVVCYAQKFHTKMQRSSKKAIYHISSLRFLNNLKNQFHFQRAYWVQQNKLKKEGQTYLDSKYQKIGFLYEIFDCANHFISRKGFRIIGAQTERQFMTTVQSHPAYQNYYRLVKLKKYFSAIKNYLFSQTAQKIKDVKYKVCGKRLLNNGLMSWYKSHLKMCIYQEEIKQKQYELQVINSSQRKIKFFQILAKIGQYEKKQNRLFLFVKRQRIVRALMILKTNKVSKQYYRKLILSTKIKQKMKLVQSSFLEWKLLYRQSLHHRLLSDEMNKIIKKSGIRKLNENIAEYFLADKIYRKKAQKLKQIVFFNKAESAFSLLRTNYHQSRLKKRLPESQIKGLTEKLLSTVKDMRKKFFIRELVQFWFQRKLQGQILSSIDMQYENRLKAKVFEGLKVMYAVQRLQKVKIYQIQKKKSLNQKRKIFSKMIDSTILKITLRRTLSLAKKFWLKSFFKSLLKKMLIEQDEQSLEENDQLA